MTTGGGNAGSVIISTKYGWMGILFSEKGLRRITLPCESQAEARRKLGCEATPTDSSFVEIVRKQITEYFRGTRRSFKFKYDVSEGTVFQRAVWQCAGEIPYGQVRSYRYVAEKIGRPGAYRAVGQALACNPVPLIIPCHRVIYSGGKLGGFGGKANIRDFKHKLLLLEGAMTDKCANANAHCQVNENRRSR